MSLVLTLVGGSLDGYTFLTREGVFATAQTGNVALFGVAVARGEWRDAGLHVLPIVAFAIGVLLAATLLLPPVARFVRRPARVALVGEIVVLAVVAALPTSVPDEVAVLLVAAVGGTQVTMFRRVRDWSYNSMFQSSNIRSFARSMYTAVLDRNAAAARQAGVFASVIAAFTVGAVLGGLGVRAFHDHGVWISAALLVVAFVLFVVNGDGGRRGMAPLSANG